MKNNWHKILTYSLSCWGHYCCYSFCFLVPCLTCWILCHRMAALFLHTCMFELQQWSRNCKYRNVWWNLIKTNMISQPQLCNFQRAVFITCFLFSLPYHSKSFFNYYAMLPLHMSAEFASMHIYYLYYVVCRIGSNSNAQIRWLLLHFFWFISVTGNFARVFFTLLFHCFCTLIVLSCSSVRFFSVQNFALFSSIVCVSFNVKLSL